MPRVASPSWTSSWHNQNAVNSPTENQYFWCILTPLAFTNIPFSPWRDRHPRLGQCNTEADSYQETLKKKRDYSNENTDEHIQSSPVTTALLQCEFSPQAHPKTVIRGEKNYFRNIIANLGNTWHQWLNAPPKKKIHSTTKVRFCSSNQRWGE